MPILVRRLDKLIVGLLFSPLILKVPDIQESTPDKNCLNVMLARREGLWEQLPYGLMGNGFLLFNDSLFRIEVLYARRDES